MDDLVQVMALQSIPITLAHASDRRPLATGEVAVSDLPRDKERLQKVLDHLHRHYDQPCVCNRCPTWCI
jgi:hypothetical protein